MKYYTAMTIAGSDSCGGAGVQADIKTMSALGVYAASAITAITVQNTLGVYAIRLMQEDALSIFIQELLPLATLLTPNIPEAEILAGTKIQNKEDIQNAALAINKLGCKYVLIKGGHFQGAEKVDYLFEDGKPITSFRGISVNTRNTHGTGCTLSSAITSYLAREMDMNTAIAMAKTYLSGAILAGKDMQIGKGHGPVNHFYEPKALFIK